MWPHFVFIPTKYALGAQCPVQAWTMGNTVDRVRQSSQFIFKLDTPGCDVLLVLLFWCLMMALPCNLNRDTGFNLSFSSYLVTNMLQWSRFIKEHQNEGPATVSIPESPGKSAQTVITDCVTGQCSPNGMCLDRTLGSECIHLKYKYSVQPCHSWPLPMVEKETVS